MYFKQSRYFDKNNENSGNYCKEGAYGQGTYLKKIIWEATEAATQRCS